MSEGSSFLHRATESIAITVLVALLIAAPAILYLNSTNKNLQGKELTFEDIDLNSTNLPPLDPVLAKRAEEALIKAGNLKDPAPQKNAINNAVNNLKKQISNNNAHFVNQGINNLENLLNNNTGSGNGNTGTGDTGTGGTGAGTGDTGTGNGDTGSGNGDPDPGDEEDYGWASARAGRPVQADTCRDVPTLRANPIVVTPSGGDNDEAQIKQAITQGIAEGRDVRLSEGTFVLSSSISVPSTHNFRIMGSGSDKTFITTAQRIKGQIFSFGNSNIQLHNNWGIANHAQIEVGTIEDNTNTVIANEGQAAPTVGHWVIIWDQQYYSDPDFRIYITAELLKVTAYDPATRRVTFDIPVGRTYGRDAKLALVNKFVSSDIAVGGFTYDGFVPEEVSNSWSGGAVTVGMTHRLKVHDIKTIHYSGWNFDLKICRECDVSNVDQSGIIAKDRGAGAGYGVVFSRSRLSTICDSEGRGGHLRHTFVSHSGNMDLNYINVGGRVDGRMSSLRIYITDSELYGNTFGNGRWHTANVLSGGAGGGNGHRVENSNSPEYSFCLLANTDDVMYRNVNIHGLCLGGSNGPVGKYTFLSSKLGTFKYFWGVLEWPTSFVAYKHGEGLFIDTVLAHLAEGTSGRRPIATNSKDRRLGGDLEFRNCTFYTNSFNQPPISLNLGEIPDHRELIITDSTFLADRSEAISYGMSTNLTLILRNNTLKTNQANLATAKLINVPDNHTMTYFEETGTKIEVR
jgi:hypothetical protein